jgi:hypothetical protein
MSANPHIVDAFQLRELSGKRTASAVRRWATRQGIKVLDGGDGPWATVEAVNAALGVGSANDHAYRPEDVL